MRVVICAGNLSELIVALANIDWQRPWLAPFKAAGQLLAAHDDWPEAANRMLARRDLRTVSGHLLRFVPQRSLPVDLAYEAHIHATGEVPTRDNLHDFFNALIWLHFPRIKRTLNGLHVASQRESIGSTDAPPTGSRGRTRDAATLFDENAALFVCSDPKHAEYLRAHQWAELLQHAPTEFFSNTAVVLFGHALIEKLVNPYKAITAHVWITAVNADWFQQDVPAQIADLDQRVASAINTGLAAGDFAHLPVLGVPGWWEGQDSDFYRDTAVFRPVRQSSAALTSIP